MSKGYRRLWPDIESIVFDGGLDNNYPVALIPNNESPSCQNVIFYNGAVETRDGAQKLNTTPAGSVAFDGLYTRRDNSGAETMIAFIGGGMMTLAGTTFTTVPSAQSVFTIGNRVGAEFSENYMFVGNGQAGPYKWNGTDFTQHGISAPVSGPSATWNGGGQLLSAATYMYKISFFNTNLVEGNVSTASTFVTPLSPSQVALSGIAVGVQSAGVSRRRIYRTAANGVQFLKVADILDNTTTTYIDNLADGGLGVAAPLDNGTPPIYNAIINIRGRLFMNDVNNPNLVWYTNVNNPYVVASTNFFRIGDKTIDLVKGFATWNNQLMIFCEKSVWINYMPNPADDTTWRQMATNSSYGTKSPFGMFNYNNKVLFPATQNTRFSGFGAMDGISLDPTSTLLTVTNAGSLLQSDRIEPDMFLTKFSLLGDISAIAYKNRGYISVPYGTNALYNNRIWCFDFSLENTMREQTSTWVPFTGLNAKQFAIYNQNLYYASSDTTGFVFQIEGTGIYNDNGVAIDSYYYTKEFSGFDEDTNYYKDFRFINVLVDNAGTYFMNITYRTDSDAGVGDAQTINLGSNATFWGSMIWGTNNWGLNSLQSEYRVFLSPKRGKRIQFRFDNQNTINQRFKVHRLNFDYNIRGYR